MSTPGNKLETAAATLSADAAKVKSVWQHWEIYIVAAVCLIVGAIVGHKLL
jgi:hypothetical protein